MVACLDFEDDTSVSSDISLNDFSETSSDVEKFQSFGVWLSLLTGTWHK